MPTPSEIMKDVNSFRNDTNFLDLKARWRTDFDLYRMKPYNPGKGYMSYTSNDPRVYADKMLALLNSSKLIFRIPDELLTEQLRATASNCERLLYGAYTLIDSRLLRLPGRNRLRAQKSWHAAIRGGYASRCYTYKDARTGETIIDVAIFDLYNLAYGLNRDGGVKWSAHSTYMSPTDTRGQYGEKVRLDRSGNRVNSVEVVEYWDDKMHGIFVGNEWVEQGTHDLGYCPVYLFLTETMPAVWQDNYQYTTTHRGESIYAPNRYLHPNVNKTMSDMLTLIRRGVKVPMGYWSAMGEKTVPTDIWQTEKAATLALQFGEEVKPIIPPTMPADTTPAINWMAAEIQRGSLPNTAYGTLGFRLSGFAISQLQGTMESVLTPIINCIKNSYMVEAESILKQYASGSWKPLKVRGRTSRNQPFGYPQGQEIKPSDIEGDWNVEVELLPLLPRDDAQKYELAVRAREGEIPLLSDRSIRSKILEIEDPDLEDDIIRYEWADNLILNKLYDAYMFALLEEKNPDKAANILVELRRLQAAQAPTGAGGGGRPSSPRMRAAMETPGAGMPAQSAAGFSPQTMPTESLGGMPGGAMNAQMPMFSEAV